MAATFSLSLYPYLYVAQNNDNGSWTESFHRNDEYTQETLTALPADERSAVLARRNQVPDLPLVNYTTQYGMGCFEGLKAFPQPDGTLKIFRPDENGKRMNRSMAGLKMPAFPVDTFVDAVLQVVSRNRALGYAPSYDSAWEKDNFLTAQSIYIRPFSYSEPGIGLNLSKRPYVVIATTPVGSYFDPDADHRAITTDRVRATKGGTGWIKCDANYVIPTIVKFEMQEKGFMEAIFLDAVTQTFVEEGSSSNIFFLLKDGTLVTPSLEDTILPGITRKSIIQLAQDRGVKTAERRITIDEVMSEAVESFVTGTAAGISYIESISHQGSEVVFRDRKIGDLTRNLLHELKGIQYGAVEDRHNWMVTVPAAD